MDYPSTGSGQAPSTGSGQVHGTELFKYQWDFIHNPEGGWFVFEDSEEGMSMDSRYAYSITLDGEKVLDINPDKFKTEVQKVIEHQKREGDLDGYPFEVEEVYIINSNKNDYTISSTCTTHRGRACESDIYWKSNDTFFNELMVNFYSENSSLKKVDLYYRDSERYWPIYEVQLHRVNLNVAYKTQNTPNHVLNDNGKQVGVIDCGIVVNSNTIDLCPFFPTITTSAFDIEKLFARNGQCVDFIDSIRFNGNKITPVSLDWETFTLSQGENTYEIFAGATTIRCIIERPVSVPFVTVKRKQNNTQTDYYIEDYFSTPPVIHKPGVLDENLGMKTITIDGYEEYYQTSSYVVPIVHFKNETTVKMKLTSTNQSNRSVAEQKDFFYVINGNQIKIGEEFEVTASINQIINIFDINEEQRGAVEFRKFSESEETLEPLLNLVYLDETLPGGMTLSGIVADLNRVYNTMGVNWIPGETIRLTISEYYESGGKINPQDIVDAISNRKDNQYYMIIVKADDANREPFVQGPHAYTHPSLSKNYFLQLPEYRILTPRHELAHCNGIDEFAYDFGITTPNQISRQNLLNNEFQRETTNVMGYNSNNIDFYSWQIHIIRQKIRDRINNN